MAGCITHSVPARVGGVDLSASLSAAVIVSAVPARVGGVDLSTLYKMRKSHYIVPARVGGVDLSMRHYFEWEKVFGPRPCGRGGFKPSTCMRSALYFVSPRPCGRGGFKHPIIT